LTRILGFYFNINFTRNKSLFHFNHIFDKLLLIKGFYFGRSMIKKFIWLILLLFSSIIYSDYAPLFTGPLLAPSGVTIPKGHINIEPYFFYTDNQGIYNRHWHTNHVNKSHSVSLNPFLITYGLNDFLDMQMSFPLNINRVMGQHGAGISDLNVLLGIQVIRQSENNNLPDLRISLGETFPTGKYNNLNPTKASVEGNGFGVYETALSFNFQKLYKLFNHYLRNRVILRISSPNDRVNLKGFTSYGGGFGTRGSLHVGNNFVFDTSIEYSLTRNWVGVFEVQVVNRDKTNFWGVPGVTQTGATPTIGHGVIDSITLAPAIEYNFSPHLGIIAGSWFTVAGRETSEFISAVIAVNYYN
jgi:hypothetical protein